MTETICGHEPHFAKGLCRKCYWQRPETKAKQKEYWQRSQNKKNNDFVNIFYNQYNQSKIWQKEGIEKMANIYATTTCELTKTQQCTLEEKILLKAKK